jgi:hypothetical protein
MAKQLTEKRRGTAARRGAIRRTIPVVALAAGAAVGVAAMAPPAGAVSKENFSRCVRLHGFERFPNGTISDNGSLVIVLGAALSVAIGSPHFNTALFTCQSLLPAGTN